MKKPTIDPSAADDLRQLAERPTFKLLASLVATGRDECLASFSRTYLERSAQKGAPAIDQREVDYLRGFWAGAMAVVEDYPKHAEKTWQRHLKQEESDTA